MLLSLMFIQTIGMKIFRSNSDEDPLDFVICDCPFSANFPARFSLLSSPFSAKHVLFPLLLFFHSDLAWGDSKYGYFPFSTLLMIR